MLTAVPASGQGVRYTLSPTAEHIQWKNDIGFPDATLPGARFALGFGRLASVEAYYGTRNDLRLTDDGPMPDASFDLRSFGADLQIHLGAGGFEPYAIGGAGITRFEPSEGDRIDRITYRYGGGIRLGLTDRLKANLFYTRNRVNGDANRILASISGTDPAGLPEALSEEFHSFGASLGYALGGSGSATNNADGWSFASIPIEPFVGRLRFEDEASPTTYLLGARAGVDIGSYFGLRGFYWQGMTDGFDDTTPIKSYGVEAQMNFNASLGPAPYLLLGAGRVDYGDDFRTTAGDSIGDQNAFIVGAGIGIRVSDKLRFNAAIRDFIMSGTDLEDVASTDQLTHNVLLSAGLTFNLGRGRSSVDRPVDEPRRDWTDGRAAASPGVITLPAPTNGELYVRYGDADSLRPMGLRGGMDPATLRTMIRQIVREELAGLGATPGAMPMTAQDSLVERIVERLRERDARVTPAPAPAPADSLDRAALERLVADRVAAELARQTPQAVVTPAPAPAPVQVVQVPVVSVGETVGTRRFSRPTLYGGLAINQPVQLIAGGRFDYGSLLGVEQLRFVPEAAIGIGAGSSFLVAGNAELQVGAFNVGKTRVHPRVRLGLGLLHVSDDGDRDGLDAVLNLTYGVVIPRATGRSGPAITIEHQGLDFFDFNRLLVGLQWGF